MMARYINLHFTYLLIYLRLTYLAKQQSTNHPLLLATAGASDSALHDADNVCLTNACIVIIINRSHVRLPADALSDAALGKLYTHVPLSPSSIIWYRC